MKVVDSLQRFFLQICIIYYCHYQIMLPKFGDNMDERVEKGSLFIEIQLYQIQSILDTVEHTYDACPKYSELGSFRIIAYLYVSDRSHH